MAERHHAGPQPELYVRVERAGDVRVQARRPELRAVHEPLRARLTTGRRRLHLPGARPRRGGEPRRNSGNE